MRLLRPPEGRRRRHPRPNRPSQAPLQLGHGPARRGGLLVRVRDDQRAVLRAPVRALRRAGRAGAEPPAPKSAYEISGRATSAVRDGSHARAVSSVLGGGISASAVIVVGDDGWWVMI